MGRDLNFKNINIETITNNNDSFNRVVK